MTIKNQTFDNDFFRTTSVSDFKLKVNRRSPLGYPTSQIKDEYSKTIFEKCYQKRKKALTEFYLKSPAVLSSKGIYNETLRLKENAIVHKGVIEASVDYVNNRIDCADFIMNGFLRLYYQFINSDQLDDELRKKIKNMILDFKYWPDEPGIDSMCYWTENHHIIFSTCEYLAGQLFPEEVFRNSNQKGKEKKERAKKRILKWFELRFYTGFSEWLSNVYYDESMPPLINLFDLAEDEEIKKKAKDIIDLMFFDMALNSYYGIFSSTHGRTYTEEKTQPLREDTIDTSKLVFGQGVFTNKNNMGAYLLLMSDYEIPKILVDIANDNCEVINKQRVSIKFKDKKKWGYHKKTTESALGLLSFGGYSHPQTFNYLVKLLDDFNWWENKFFLELQPFKKLIGFGKHIGLTTLVAKVLKKDLSRNTMTEANLYTYKTKDYMLSTAQDYLKSMGGDQHHIWNATLDNEAVVFTTHPGGYTATAPDGYFHGNGFMPKSVQYKNVNITMYKTPKTPTIVIKEILDFTHVFFPRDRFEVVVENNNWIFGKSNDGYIALRSSNPYKWVEFGEWANQEIIVQGRRSIYITELGSKEQHGSFINFIESVIKSKVAFNGLNVEYHSPTVGKVTTGWNKPLKVKGKLIKTKDYDRYSNQFSKTSFMDDEINIKYKNQTLTIKR